MSYVFRADRGYRMPTHFGPLPGPRYAPSGGFRAVDEGQRQTIIWADFAADADQIAALLPEGFEPAPSADLHVELKNMTGIGWLGGRGYSVGTITTGVRRVADDGHPTEGRFKLILWENHADPIITGREELGYPKVFGDITEVQDDGASASASISWDGYTFLTLELHDLAAGSGAAPAGPSFHTKYIPRTGVAGGHDLVQTILTPPGQGPLEVLERRVGTGTLTLTRGTFEQLPTLGTVVDALADLRLGKCLGAGLLRTAGTTDLRDQIVLDPN